MDIKAGDILSEICKRDLGTTFWHEKNGLYTVDNIELLEDQEGNKKNLDLTYAVRDGIISHCGEIDENAIKPRNEAIDLKEYKSPNSFQPYTWEGCTVKVADKISYIGRDIEDAIKMGILDEHLNELYEILGKKVNNTVIINNLIYDLCNNSTIESGLKFSDEALQLMDKIKQYNYQHIYASKRFEPSKRFFNIVINEIYNTLKSTYDGTRTVKKLQDESKFYPKLATGFLNWIDDYWNIRSKQNLKNRILFDINNEKDYYSAIIYYISGMTDKYAIEMYKEVIHF